MKFMTRFTFVGLGLILSVCLLTTPALAQIEMKNLTGLWLFDEGSGDVAADSSNSALDATVVGNPTWVSGVFGSGLELNGSDAYVEVPAHVNPTDAITVSIWVKSMTDDWNQHGWMVEKRNAYIIHPNARIPKTFLGRFVTGAAGTSPVAGAMVKSDRMTSLNGISIPPLSTVQRVSGISILMAWQKARWKSIPIQLMLTMVSFILVGIPVVTVDSAMRSLMKSLSSTSHSVPLRSN